MTSEQHPEVAFLEYVVKSFVDHPEEVQIVRSVDNMGVLLRLTVHKEDMGRVVGKDGKMAQLALRPLLHAVGMKHNSRVSLKVEEPAGSKREHEVKTVDQVVDEIQP